MVFSCNPRVPFRQSVSRTLSTIKQHCIQITSQWPDPKVFPSPLCFTSLRSATVLTIPSPPQWLVLSSQPCCCCCSVAKLCLTLCDPINCSMPGFSVLSISLSLLKLMSIESVMPYNHLILCHPPYPLALNLSQHQGLFQWFDSSHKVAEVLELQLQHQSLQWIQGWFP